MLVSVRGNMLSKGDMGSNPIPTAKIKVMYIVGYYGGQYMDSYTRYLFVTDNETLAIEYINKFNRILEKWKNHFVKYTEEDGIMKKEFINTPAFRYYQIENITECFYQKIEYRK